MTHLAARVPVILALGLLAAFAGVSPASAEDEPFPPDPPNPADVVKYSCRTDVGERLCPFIVCVGAGSSSAVVRVCPDATD